jgi:hypothetical protein
MVPFPLTVLLALRKNSQYQILYFPLDNPLDEEQRELRRNDVTTTAIC